MAKDDRDLLEVLKFELKFLEAGGYGRSVRTPWLPTSVFQDSLSCLNFGDPHRSQPCEECILMSMVPPDRRNEQVPCHHIPLSDAGETIYFLERWENQSGLEEAVKKWLRATIKKLEDQRASKSPAVTTPSSPRSPVV
jgi:hypothetical protein